MFDVLICLKLQICALHWAWAIRTRHFGPGPEAWRASTTEVRRAHAEHEGAPMDINILPDDALCHVPGHGSQGPDSSRREDEEPGRHRQQRQAGRQRHPGGLPGCRQGGASCSTTNAKWVHASTVIRRLGPAALPLIQSGKHDSNFVAGPLLCQSNR